MKTQKLNLLTLFLMISATFLSVLMHGADVQAATTGEIPCSEGAVTWTLDDNGVLTFSGNGTTDLGTAGYSSWKDYWENMSLDKTAVIAVRVEANNKIQLDTCMSMFENFSNCDYMDLSGFDTSNVINMSRMFCFCESLNGLDVSRLKTDKVTDMSLMFDLCKSLTEIDVSKFDTSKVTNMRGMFDSCQLLKEIDVSKFDTGNVTNMSWMFHGCRVMEPDLSGFDTSKVTNMAGMFSGGPIVKLDLSGFDTSNVTNMGDMFSYCDATEIDVSGFDTGKVTNMEGMFSDCNVKELDLSGFDTSNVTDMQDMFRYCNVTRLDLSGFDTSNVTNMCEMFAYCDATEIDVSKFDTGKVTNMCAMFGDCDATELDVSGFDTCNVTNMGSMFAFCDAKELDVSGFDTSKATNMRWMFRCCAAKELDVSGFDTRNVTNMNEMFKYCQVKELDVSNFNTSSVTNMGGMFADCELLTELNLENFDTGNVTDTEDFNSNCTSLNKIITPKTKITITLPELAADKYWLDTEKKFYQAAEYTFDKSTEIHRVNGSYNINYIFDGELINCPKTYLVTEGITTFGTVQAKCKKFAGWYLDSEYTKPITSIEKGTFGDFTLYGKLEPSHDIDRENGTIIKPATEKEVGTIQYKCKNCTYNITEEIPKLPSSEDKKPEAPSDPTESNIINTENEKDVKGSSFAKIQARAAKTTRNTICLKWNKVKDAEGYLIYGTKCGKKNKYKFIKTIKGNKTTTFTQKKLKKGTYYRYIVRAYKTVEGEKVNVAVSKTIHATTTGGKYGNAKSVKVNKKNITLGKNKTFKLKASEVKQSKKIDKHRKVLFESSDKSIATVSQKGVVKGKKKGTCYIYAYAQNGVYKKIKVQVK